MKHVNAYKLNEIICSSKQSINKDKCRCEFKELIEKRVCDKGYILILVIVDVNVLRLVIPVNIYIIQIVSVKKTN